MKAWCDDIYTKKHSNFLPCVNWITLAYSPQYSGISIGYFVQR